MHDEYNALVKNGTWILVPRPAGINLVRSMCLFKHKFHADGTLSRYKARLVANGSSQQLGIDCDETFSPVVKPATIRTVLSPAVSCKWPIHQLDVKNAFLMEIYLKLYICTNHQALWTPGYATRVGFYHSRCDSSLFILRQGSQKQYAIKLLARAHMTNCNPSRTPVDTDSKLGPEGIPVQDPTLYRSLAGGLQYLTFTRLDISYIMRIEQAAPQQGGLLQVTVFFLGNNLLSWSSKRQQTISRSSTEAEYQGVANVVAETAWLRNLLRELHSPLSAATLVYCDNVSATHLYANPVQHQRTKHIEIDIHFVRDLVTAGQVRVLHVPSRYQYADIFTKGLPLALFEDFRSSLSVRLPSAPTAGEYWSIVYYRLSFVFRPSSLVVTLEPSMY
nr:ribonuclease H-like domain-containing protein [Tanacetum cinerariifolium]